MKHLMLIIVALTAFCSTLADIWPDGTEIGPWFRETAPVETAALGKAYRFNDNFIFPDGETHTREIQVLIDRAAKEGGGVIVVPPGVYRTGSLFFKPGVHLHLEEGAVLFGSDSVLFLTRFKGGRRTI